HVDIPAPVDAVFAFMDDPAHQPEITPSLTRSELVERLPNGGSRVRYTYRILGVSFDGEVRATDYAPNDRIVWAMTGDLRGTLRWYFSPLDEDSGTRFTYAATYVLPGPGLARPLLGPLVRRYNEREVDRLLQALRARLAESG
ncbi:MAG: SRPBCC family protein, partial [Salinivenus sp.]